MNNPAKYMVDTKVVVRPGPPEDHCRTPYYLRGKPGRIVAVLGCFRDPARMAFHKPGLPLRHLYRVEFQQIDVWPNYQNREDKVFADIYEDWLESVNNSAPSEVS